MSNNYGEPVKVIRVGHGCEPHLDAIVDCTGFQADLHRAAVCMNELAGVKNPAEALAAAREALKVAGNILEDHGFVSAARKCRAALALL